ncbi:MAG TPA: host attachment protein [Albitalea sp.]|jgi:protein required for attachment to host cells|nr:host attachment protein [Albitalea sp.]
MDATWIVLADEGRARILSRPQRGAELVEVEEIADPAAHAHNADLRRDAYGRRHGGDGRMGANQTESAGLEKLDHEAELFARRVTERLLDAHHKHRFAELRIAAAPRFLGRLRQVMDPQLKKAVVEELDKDLLQLDARELTQRLFPEDRNG